MNAKNSNTRRRAFTLIELIVSLALFAGVMALLMQYFSSAQRVWMNSSAKSEMFENARVALDLIENDLMCSYYSYGHDSTKLFFYPQGSQKQFGVAVLRPAPPNKGGVSSICEIQYKLDTAKARLLMNVVGDVLSDGTANTYWDVTTFSTAVTGSSNPSPPMTTPSTTRHPHRRTRMAGAKSSPMSPTSLSH